MCFGVPMQIIKTEEFGALCEGGGRRERVSLALTGPLKTGEHVLVHLGSAIRVLDPDEARQIADAIRAVEAAAAGENFDHLLQDLIDREPELPAHLRADTPPTHPSQPRKTKENA